MTAIYPRRQLNCASAQAGGDLTAPVGPVNSKLLPTLTHSPRVKLMTLGRSIPRPYSASMSSLAVCLTRGARSGSRTSLRSMRACTSRLINSAMRRKLARFPTASGAPVRLLREHITGNDTALRALDDSVSHRLPLQHRRVRDSILAGRSVEARTAMQTHINYLRLTLDVPQS